MITRGGDRLDRLERLERLEQLDGLDRLDRLDLGRGAGPRRRAPWWRSAALLVLGALVGWGAHASTTRSTAHPATGDRQALFVGSFQQNLLDPFGPELVVSLTNAGRAPVDVTNVTPLGWRTRMDPVQVLPGTSVDVPVEVSLDCATVRLPGDGAVVRFRSGASSRSVVLPMMGSPALGELFIRRCGADDLPVPTRRDLLGTWLVAQGGLAFTGRMFIALHPDGRYEMDAGPHLADDPGAIGRFSLHGSRLTLVATQGGDCGGRRRAVWDVGLRAGDQLRIRQLTTYDGYCAVDRGDVWIAERIS